MILNCAPPSFSSSVEIETAAEGIPISVLISATEALLVDGKRNIYPAFAPLYIDWTAVVAVDHFPSLRHR